MLNLFDLQRALRLRLTTARPAPCHVTAFAGWIAGDSNRMSAGIGEAWPLLDRRAIRSTWRTGLWRLAASPLKLLVQTVAKRLAEKICAHQAQQSGRGDVECY